jgi:hypothetical protein
MREDRLLRCSLFRSLPFWPLLMSLLSDCGRSVPFPRLWLGEPLARRSVAKAGTGRGRLPPGTAGLEVTPPQADEPWPPARGAYAPEGATEETSVRALSFTPQRQTGY